MGFLRSAAPSPTARKVIVTDGAGGQSRSALATVQALGQAGLDPIVTVTDQRSLAAASRWCRGKLTVPALADDPDGFRERLHDAVGRPDVLLALATSDAALITLVPSTRPLIDKANLAARADAAGLRGVPGTTAETIEDVAAAAEHWGYPMVVKPTVSTLPAVRLDDAADLDRYLSGHLAASPRIVQPYLPDGIHAIAGVLWDGEMLLAIHQRYLRTWPTDCGTSSAAVTTAPDEELESGVRRLLAGHDGIFQVQFSGPHVIDVNLRAYGSMPLATAAGLNLPAAVCGLVRGRTLAKRRAPAGLHYRWPEGDVRSVLSARRAGTMSNTEVLAALMPRRGTAHSVYRLVDPMPGVARLVQAARRGGRGAR